MTEDEEAVVGRVMSAVEWTYVAAVFSSVASPFWNLEPTWAVKNEQHAELKSPESGT